MACFVLAGCAGPIALDRSIDPQHRREYEAVAGLDLKNQKAAWIAWRAGQQNISEEEARRADETMSTVKNPFDTRRDAEAVSRGAVIYEVNCARCHGIDARGKGPAVLPDHPCADFHSFGNRFAVTIHGGAPRTWFRKITSGYGEEVDYPSGRSSAMPAFGDTLAREQIWLVITYLQSLDMYAQRPDEGG